MKKSENAKGPPATASNAGPIRVGVGGWTYAPWRDEFFPKGLVQSRELSYASEHLTSIEINGTFYRTQTAKTFAKWRDETPDDFVFSVKAPRYVVQRRVLAETGDSVARFLESGVLELKSKLGPLLWQFAPTKVFDERDFSAFLELLPSELGGAPLRHALEVRHPSFMCAPFIDLARRRGAAIVIAGDSKYPLIADRTATFSYLRVMGSLEGVKNGYKPKAINAWADRLAAIARGEVLGEFPIVAKRGKASGPLDVFCYFISGFKTKNPAAAMAMLDRLRATKAIV
jgi:uncharacterized protein YecE (DUF72 family)